MTLNESDFVCHDLDCVSRSDFGRHCHLDLVSDFSTPILLSALAIVQATAVLIGVATRLATAALIVEASQLVIEVWIVDVNQPETGAEIVAVIAVVMASELCSHLGNGYRCNGRMMLNGNVSEKENEIASANAIVNVNDPIRLYWVNEEYFRRVHYCSGSLAYL